MRQVISIKDMVLPNIRQKKDSILIYMLSFYMKSDTQKLWLFCRIIY